MEILFNYDKKKNLAKKIEKIKKKKYLVNILKIIIQNEPDKKFIENDNGIFMFFHNYKNDTYVKIKNYIEKIKKKKKNTISEDSQTLSDNKYMPYENEILELSENKNNSIKLSNKEKNLIKRKVFNNKLTNSINKSKKEIIKKK
jgi:hypothetical protein